MTKIRIFSKKMIFFIALLHVSICMHCLEANTKVLNESNYRKKSNWSEVEEKFTEVQIKYKIQIFEGTPIITELYYYGKDKNDKKILLGSFSKVNGFLNSERKEFLFDSTLKKDADFFTTKLLGLSIDSIDKPFSLKGIAMSSKNTIYETETLCRLYINCNKTSLEEWFPDL